MIDSLSSQMLSTASADTTSSTSIPTTNGAFDAALAAAQKRDAAEQARTSELASIREKGFSAWVRDTQMEKLKEKLREQVMSEMGVDEDSMAQLSPVMQQILEQKIQEEVDKRLQEEQAKQQQQQDGKNQSALAAAQNSQAGKNDQSGKDCPVIPALAWPGAASLL